MKNQVNNTKSFRVHLNEQYGEQGTQTRDEYEAGFEAFKLGVLLLELRKKQGLTQEELANKCGTTNNTSDIRLSTVIRIFKQGFNKDLRLTVI